MNTNANSRETGFADDVTLTGKIGSYESSAADLEDLSADVCGPCEFDRLNQEAGIDPSSLTDVQIMEALYQMR